MGDVGEAERVWEEMTFSKVMDVDDNWMERFFQKEVTVRELIKELMSCLKDGGVDVTPLKELIHQVLDEEKSGMQGLIFPFSHFPYQI